MIATKAENSTKPRGGANCMSPSRSSLAIIIVDTGAPWLRQSGASIAYHKQSTGDLGGGNRLHLAFRPAEMAKHAGIITIADQLVGARERDRAPGEDIRHAEAAAQAIYPPAAANLSASDRGRPLRLSDHWIRQGA